MADGSGQGRGGARVRLLRAWGGPRRSPSLEDAVLAASVRGPGARTRSELVPPSGRRLVPAPATGILLAVDEDALVDVAARHDLVVALERRVGDPAVAATPLLSWWSASARVPGEEEERRLDAEVIACATLGPGPASDVDSRLRTLVAAGDLDALAAALALLARLPDPPAARLDAAGFLRLISPESPFEARLAAAMAELEATPAPRLLLLLRECAFTATLPRRRAAVAVARDRVLGRASDDSRLVALSAAVDAALEGRWVVL